MKRKASQRLIFAANAFIVLSIVFYWIETAVLLNPVAIGLLLAFGLHMFAAKNNAKFLFPLIFIFINAFMFLALFSEFQEFASLTIESMPLLIFGILYLGFNIVSSIIIIRSVEPENLIQMEVK